MTNQRPAVFLDRDGVINVRRSTLVRNWPQFRFLPGAKEAIAALTGAGYAVVVATNQEWVDWGYISWQDHEDVHARMVKEIEASGGRVERVYACVHRPSRGCACRKPKPGMLLEAARELHIDLARSWFVGDNRKDMVAGRAAGVTTVLVDPRWRTRWQGAEDYADVVAAHLPDAVRRILEVAPVPAEAVVRP